MDQFTFVIPTLLGVEGLTADELRRMNMQQVRAENGRVFCQGTMEDIPRLNLRLRTGERVLISLGTFPAHSFEDLFQGTKALPWEEFIPSNGAFPVKGFSLNSTLHSVPACQKIVKKAIVDRLSEAYGISEFPETGAEYTVKATLLKDRVTLTVDTSGAGLHKRGYRIKDVAAPIKETLAAAMVQLSFWKEGRILVDPCCGSGTIPIEAALIGRNIAPGLNRSFACEDWEFIDKNLWKEEKRAAFQAIRYDEKLDITGMDIDPKAVAAAKQNAEEAGVEDCIHFRRADAAKLHAQGQNGILITNPPYGERIGEEKEIQKIYGGLKNFLQNHPDWSLFLVTTDKDAEEKILQRKADRRRKLYNGRLEVCYYQFHGQKPGK